jgi:hypothetical protein
MIQSIVLHVFVFTVIRADDHSHVADSFAARRGVVLLRMQQATKRDPTVPVRRLYDVAAEEDSGESDELPSFESVRSRVKRVRGELMPRIPATIDDVVIDGNWSRTWKDRNFLSLLDNDWGIAIFFTEAMLKVLQRAECLFIDGTFRTAPHPYVQFLTIHGLYLGHVIPLVFCLVTGKTIGQYRQIIQHLKSEVRRLTHRRLRPRRIVLDFEQALMTALETELPTSTLSGCYFHFNQSLWRHLQQVGLATHYRHDRRLQRAVRKVMAMGFLPVILVRQNFNLLRNGGRTRRLIRQYPALSDWLDYVETTYMTNNSAFPPPIWNVFGRTMDTRTNNHLEGTTSLSFVI